MNELNFIFKILFLNLSIPFTTRFSEEEWTDFSFNVGN